MGLLQNFKRLLFPPQVTDPEFGKLTFMNISNHPERSYWECEWNFPATGTIVSISLPGGESGPGEASRSFYLNLAARYDVILAACRPKLEQVFRDWRNGQIPPDISKAVRLAGFSVEQPDQTPLRWDVSFETTDDPWLGITISFMGDAAQEPEVDS